MQDGVYCVGTKNGHQIVSLGVSRTGLESRLNWLWDLGQVTSMLWASVSLFVRQGWCLSYRWLWEWDWSDISEPPSPCLAHDNCSVNNGAVILTAGTQMMCRVILCMVEGAVAQRGIKYHLGSRSGDKIHNYGVSNGKLQIILFWKV